MFQCDLARATPLDVEWISFRCRPTATARHERNGSIVSDLRGEIAGRHVVRCEGVVDSDSGLVHLDLLRSGIRRASKWQRCRQGSVRKVPVRSTTRAGRSARSS